LPFNQIDFELLDILDKFEPYGEANSKPKFTNLVEIVDVSDIGANKEHRRYRFKDVTNRILSAVEFRSKKSHSRGDSAKLTFSVGRNEYNGNVYINLYVDELN
jgi:single-stranded-DNA-specific exonuclease